MKAFSIEWNKALVSKHCGGYYSTIPCRAKSANKMHKYCKVHKKVLKKFKNEKENKHL